MTVLSDHAVAKQKGGSAVLDIVLLHGWGLNSGIWADYKQLLQAQYPHWRVHSLDLPGYGTQADKPSSSDLAALASSCLERAPKKAVWVGWSLGGMVAMQAAMNDARKQIVGLQLIGASARFVTGDDWPQGVDPAIFQRFADELKADYQQALEMFLLLQSGANKGARVLAKKALASIAQYNDPSADTLQLGIDCLAKSDLRPLLASSDVFEQLPVQVVVGRLDRVANGEGGRLLAQQLGGNLVEIQSGHAPFLTHADDVLGALTSLVVDIDC